MSRLITYNDYLLIKENVLNMSPPYTEIIEGNFEGEKEVFRAETTDDHNKLKYWLENFHLNDTTDKHGEYQHRLELAAVVLLCLLELRKEQFFADIRDQVDHKEMLFDTDDSPANIFRIGITHGIDMYKKCEFDFTYPELIYRDILQTFFQSKPYNTNLKFKLSLASFLIPLDIMKLRELPVEQKNEILQTWLDEFGDIKGHPVMLVPPILQKK